MMAMTMWSREYMLQCNNDDCLKKGMLLKLQEHIERRFIFKCEGCGNEVNLIENSICFSGKR